MQDTTNLIRNYRSAGRILELDALRGLAALAVVLFHYTTRYDQLFGHRLPLTWSLPGGHYGVDLFFMLSGFVILMTLDRTTSSFRFAWGRFSRLYPAYWAAVVLTFLVVSCCGLSGQEVTLGDALINLTMVQALVGTPHVDGAYWSLQAELIFYVNMLLLFRFGMLRRPVATVSTWVALAVVVHSAQLATTTSWPMVAGLLGKLGTVASLKFIPLFGIGLLIYDARRRGQFLTGGRVALIGCLLATLLMHGLTSAAVDAMLAAVLLLAVHGRLHRLAARPLVALGAISYTLYLAHQNIGYIVIRFAEQCGATPWLAICFALGASLLAATWLHLRIEKPAMRALRSVQWPTIRSFLPRRLARVDS